MSLRGRVLRRKYSEWTMEPKSIQSQRQQLASLMKTFHIYPSAALVGPMAYVRDRMLARGELGKFPYPTIYPSTIESKLPMATTNWVLFNPYWTYTGFGQAPSAPDASYYIGYIVVDVTTDPKQPAIKKSGTMSCNNPASPTFALETVIPRAEGAVICEASGLGSTANSNVNRQELEYTLGKDLLFVALAFCQDPCPLVSTSCAFSYYVEPDSVLLPNTG